MTDEDHRLGAVRDQLLKRYLGFSFGGLHFEARDISAEIAEARRMMAEYLGRELQMPSRPSRLIHLWVVTDATAEIVGNASREVGLRGSALVVAHKRLRIQPQWRRRGFGSALLAENRDWYRGCGVESIVMEAEGDGSAFAAQQGFDFDVWSYGNRPAFRGLNEQQIRSAAIDGLIRHPAVEDTGPNDRSPSRETALAFLERLEDLGTESCRQVHRFEQRLPQSLQTRRRSRAGDEPVFTAPHEIAAFGQNEPLEVLRGSSLGLALLTLTGWSGITHL